ncbi:hypothetical protein [Halorubrum sp. PV6]|uniref:hypothetical protein n=1 Tax=Halorubrum sp. PV6 TaxID=634157 RepID=UPI001198B196|nr:hypothetical protein [Halorubrum sp. PV6]AZQ16176.1 hypothetical protein DOS48_15115 [Halorubrum sp. PV6]
MSSTGPLLGTSLVRRAAYAVGLIALFGIAFGFTWSQTIIVAAIVLVGESAELASPLPGLDERHFRLALGLIIVAAGGVAYWAQGDTTVAAVGVGGGGWLMLDALYSLREGIRSGDDEMADADSSEVFLSMQVGHLVAEELKDGPKTVPELADACDMTESRVHEALNYHEQADTAYKDGGQWHLDESKIGTWAFIRDNTRRALARFFRPFGLFVPS